MVVCRPSIESAPGSSFLRRASGAFLIAFLGSMLFGCDGDTLYEGPTAADPNGPPPPTGTAEIAVEITVDAADRIEMNDSIVVRERAFDPAAQSAIDRVGYSAVIRDEEGNELGRTETESFQVAAGEPVEATFALFPDWLADADLPSSMAIEIYGWAVNRGGRCAAALPGVPSQTFSCSVLQVEGQGLTVGASRPDAMQVVAVRGRTSALPSSSFVFGDLQVDTLRERAYVSNRGSSRLHVLDAATYSWGPDVNVGSEPWGLHLNATGDTLLVANSGGTSVSHVSLEGTPREVVSRRLQTRNTALFEIGLGEEEEDDEEDERPTLAGDVRFLDFSDRPQYVAQDASGRILYSTRPTVAAPLGTVRVITREGTWDEHETRILARIPQDTRSGDNTVTVMNVDSIIPYIDGRIEIWDHRPGFPDQHIQSGILPPLDALQYMATQTDSDIDYIVDRAWELEAVSFADTTYVATSRSREFVAFGDGGAPEVGRIVLWHAGSATISNRLTVADLVNNASERVRALNLNRDGSLGIARGAFGTYFFSNDLRLRGTVPENGLGGGGAALHPDHPDTPAPGMSSEVTVAFTATADREIRILDTVHYIERGRLTVRDPISGPLRVTPPFPSDNGGQGRNCSGSSCVVAKVFAATDSGGLLVLDVRASDIEGLP